MIKKTASLLLIAGLCALTNGQAAESVETQYYPLAQSTSAEEYYTKTAPEDQEEAAIVMQPVFRIGTVRMNLATPAVAETNENTETTSEAVESSTDSSSNAETSEESASVFKPTFHIGTTVMRLATVVPAQDEETVESANNEFVETHDLEPVFRTTSIAQPVVKPVAIISKANNDKESSNHHDTKSSLRPLKNSHHEKKDDKPKYVTVFSSSTCDDDISDHRKSNRASNKSRKPAKAHSGDSDKIIYAEKKVSFSTKREGSNKKH